MKELILIASIICSNCKIGSEIVKNDKTLDSYDVSSLIKHFDDTNKSGSIHDPDYSLGSSFDPYDENMEPPFKRLPYYDNNIVDFTYVERGDLVYERNQIGGIGHIGLVVEPHYNTIYGDLILTIESVGTKVQYCFLDLYRFVEKNVQLLYTCADYDTIENAVYFCERQLAKPYYFDFHRCNTSINSEDWYCSELVYAAFYYSEFDLSYLSSRDHYTCILPNQIYESSNTNEFGSIAFFLKISVLGYFPNYWRLYVKNRNNSYTLCQYDTYMCEFENGSSWTNLTNIDTLSLSNYQEDWVDIYELNSNNCAVFSFVYHYIRIITIVNNLNFYYHTLSAYYFYEWA